MTAFGFNVVVADSAEEALGEIESLIPAGPKDAKYIALNDTTVTFNLDDSVLKNREYTIRFANNDPNNDHFVNVLLFHTGDA